MQLGLMHVSEKASGRMKGACKGTTEEKNTILIECHAYWAGIDFRKVKLGHESHS
jgi:hypothetical protein